MLSVESAVLEQKISFVDFKLKKMSEWKLFLVKAAEPFFKFEGEKGINISEVAIKFKLFYEKL